MFSDAAEVLHCVSNMRPPLSNMRPLPLSPSCSLWLGSSDPMKWTLRNRLTPKLSALTRTSCLLLWDKIRFGAAGLYGPFSSAATETLTTEGNISLLVKTIFMDRSQPMASLLSSMVQWLSTSFPEYLQPIRQDILIGVKTFTPVVFSLSYTLTTMSTAKFTLVTYRVRHGTGLAAWAWRPAGHIRCCPPLPVAWSTLAMAEAGWWVGNMPSHENMVMVAGCCFEDWSFVAAYSTTSVVLLRCGGFRVVGPF